MKVEAAWRVRVRGRVQGVGFRPFVYRLAQRLGLCGRVWNDAEGVLIHAEGPAGRLAEFVSRIPEDAPPAAEVSAVEREDGAPEGLRAFTISETAAGGPGAARVPPDRVACPRCLHDVLGPVDRRHGHPLTTCTDCGPRYSLIRGMPYGRPATTLADFPMCAACAAEYRDPGGRRFHAQPISCPGCGPQVAEGEIEKAAAALRGGLIVAIKGLGGYQLLVRADDSPAVRRLRERKRRPTKPLAVMVASREEAARLAALGPAERGLLAGPAGPAVLVRKRDGAALAEEIAPGLRHVGLMLPTTPLHALLLARLDFPVVATSGNVGGEPIAVDEDEAGRLSGIADVFVAHNRPIARRVDDSVAHVVAGTPALLRLARGYAPHPLPALERLASGLPPVLAVGGHQKAALALWSGQQAVVGPHIGDLDDARTRDAFVGAAGGLAELYGCRPALVACDLHPDYASSRWAEGLGLPVERVQHHHAHAAAVMAEHGLLDQEVLAFAWDGSGYGPDGTVWGGEALVATLTGYRRVAHLRPFALPGGEAAVREPARVALALLIETLGEEEALAGAARLGLSAARALVKMIARRVNCPQTTSMGRLFDAAAAIGLGLGVAGYEGEPAARLEAVAETSSGLYRLPDGDWRPLIRAAWEDRLAGVPGGVIAWRFHEAVLGWAAGVAARHPGLPVVLGGGCFHNALLVEGLLGRLAGREVYFPAALPAGDGGLAAGQLAVALGRIREGVG